MGQRVAPRIPGHQGYVAQQIAGGRLVRGRATEKVWSYVAACECGWIGKEVSFPTSDGADTCEGEWYMVHVLPLLGVRPVKERR
ncbi:hypothetical protein [Actinocatenispora rupis]|uniref:Uncharacterized protein n=1 Tax=Actinocatenispora rupis TaxID=519421 RepID=A0A8J3JFR8_9ACTN|nr:hypothetical protein [Actinocatenispora rupis]GID14073.1 hypothetical protein Aru02nite_49620 [Actinocatenispora rupis]